MTASVAQLLGLTPRRRKSRKRPKPLRWPRAAELDYARELRGLARQAAQLVRERLLPALPTLLDDATRTSPAPRQDDVSDDLKRLVSLIARELGLGEDDEKLRRMAAKMLGQVSRQHGGEFRKTYDRSLAISPLLGQEPWLRDQMALALAENVRLIKSIPVRMLDEVEGIVIRGVTDGLLPKDMAALIEARFGVSESRALLIASDQTGKWFGQINRLRQLDAGVEEYTWSTSKDGAVRPSHRKREGKRFKWTSPPDDGHPGMPVRCRCQAVAVIEVDEL